MAMTVAAAQAPQAQCWMELLRTSHARGVRWIVALRSWDSTPATMNFNDLAETLAPCARYWDRDTKRTIPYSDLSGIVLPRKSGILECARVRLSFSGRRMIFGVALLRARGSAQFGDARICWCRHASLLTPKAAPTTQQWMQVLMASGLKTCSSLYEKGLLLCRCPQVTCRQVMCAALMVLRHAHAPSTQRQRLQVAQVAYCV